MPIIRKSRGPKVSVIIPLYEISDRFFTDFEQFNKLNFTNFEVIVVSDKKVILPKLKGILTHLLLTHKERTGPAEKRDIAIKKAKGEICAFIDDDAYPDPNWLNKAILRFKDPIIAAVGGPGITPVEDGYWEQLTGYVYGSFFCGGFARYRFVQDKLKYVNDYPAYNLLVRKRVLFKVRGYGSHFYGGEDTFLCLKIIKLNYKIIYDPEVVVYHHRRKLFTPYLKQIANIGKHRGYFTKVYPETSRGFFYFIPSILTAGFMIMGILSIFNQFIMISYVGILLILYLLGTLSVIKKGGTVKSIIASAGIISTHLVYGTFFIKGLLLRDLKR